MTLSPIRIVLEVGKADLRQLEIHAHLGVTVFSIGLYFVTVLDPTPKKSPNGSPDI
jgi:hypothetical protein